MNGPVVPGPSPATSPRRLARRALVRLAAAAALLAGVAACTEKLESGIGCPDLCPDQNVSVRDTILEPIVAGFGTVADSGALDTVLTGFPGIGAEGSLLLANRVLRGVDTLNTFAVIRFDSLTRSFTKAGGDSAITAVDSLYLQLVVDTVSARRRTTANVRLDVYDVDTSVTNLADTMVATLKPLLRPDRLIGSKVFTPDSLRDSVKVPLSTAAVLPILGVATNLPSRLRVAVVASSVDGSPVQLRLGSVNNARAAQLNYDPSPDTAVHPVRMTPFSAEPESAELIGVEASLADFTVIANPMSDEPNATLQVGGVPARRAFLRFHIPAAILDSSTIIRATLLLTQRPDPRADPSDTATIALSLSLANPTLDIARATEVIDYSNSFGLDTVRIVSADSGVRSFEMVRVVRAWKSVSAKTLQRAIVLTSVREGELPVEALFYSSEAADPLLRPRLRLSYVPSVTLGTR